VLISWNMRITSRSHNKFLLHVLCWLIRRNVMMHNSAPTCTMNMKGGIAATLHSILFSSSPPLNAIDYQRQVKVFNYNLCLPASPALPGGLYVLLLFLLFILYSFKLRFLSDRYISGYTGSILHENVQDWQTYRRGWLIWHSFYDNQLIFRGESATLPYFSFIPCIVIPQRIGRSQRCFQNTTWRWSLYILEKCAWLSSEAWRLLNTNMT